MALDFYKPVLPGKRREDLMMKVKRVRVAVIGVGGVGGYIGAKLAMAGQKNLELFFVARGEHLRAIGDRGLTVNSPDFTGGQVNIKPVAVTDKISDLGQAEVFIITVKGYDLATVAVELKPLVGEHTLILPLLNGADIYDRLRSIIPKGVILPACIYISSHITAAGVVNHLSNSARIIMGKDPNHPDFVPHNLLDLFKEAKLDCVWKEDAADDIWEKYIFISAFSLVSACYDRSIGEILAEPTLQKEVVGIMNEVFAIARKKGILLPENIVDLTIEKAGGFPYETRTSFQRDVAQGKPENELEILGGAIIEMGRKFGVTTNFTARIYNDLKKD